MMSEVRNSIFENWVKGDNLTNQLWWPNLSNQLVRIGSVIWLEQSYFKEEEEIWKIIAPNVKGLVCFVLWETIHEK